MADPRQTWVNFQHRGHLVVVWAVALLVWRFGQVEHRWETAAERSRRRQAVELALASGLTEREDRAALEPEPV